MFNTSYIQTVTTYANVGVGFLSMSGVWRELQSVGRKCSV
jgi:hypothetical protein